RIKESNVERIIGRRVIALRPHTGEKALRLVKERQYLIDQMRSQVEERSAARTAAFAPHFTSRLRAETVKMRFVGNQTPQLAADQYLFDRLEVAIPSAVLVDRQQPLALTGQVNQLRRFFRRQHEWLVDHNIAIGAQTLLGHLKMREARRSHHHQPNARIGKKLLNRSIN